MWNPAQEWCTCSRLCCALLKALGTDWLILHIFFRVSTLRPRQNGWRFADNIFKHIFFNENVWNSIKISLKFVPKGPINIIPALVLIMAWRRPGLLTLGYFTENGVIHVIWFGDYPDAIAAGLKNIGKKTQINLLRNDSITITINKTKKQNCVYLFFDKLQFVVH